MKALTTFLIIIVTVADAVRDGLTVGSLKNHTETSLFLDRDWKWLRWHLVKWTALYPPLGYILWREGFSLIETGLLAGWCLLLWVWFYQETR